LVRRAYHLVYVSADRYERSNRPPELYQFAIWHGSHGPEVRPQQERRVGGGSHSATFRALAQKEAIFGPKASVQARMPRHSLDRLRSSYIGLTAGQ
jgi:hypothetical protein